MNSAHEDLNRMLKESPVTERPRDYWEDFPRRVVARLRQAEDRSFPISGETVLWNARRLHLAWSWGFAVACLAVGIGIGSWIGTGRSVERGSSARYEKLYREMVTIFPNQVRAIIVDNHDIQLVLSETKDVAASPPLMLRIRKGHTSRDIITFSGQKTQLNGENCEVFSDGRGNVILVGRHFLWSSSDVTPTIHGCRIEARPLRTSL